MGASDSRRVIRPDPHPFSFPPPPLRRMRPRSYVEWKTLRRWNKLPRGERSVPGYLLRLARERAELTQNELAGRLGCSQQAISQAERWNSNPTVSFLRDWAHATHHELIVDLVERP